MIVSFHVATGGVVGSLTRSRAAALGLGLLTHALGDSVPHRDVGSPRFELATGLAGIAILAVARGPFDPAVAGAVGASCPDAEHVISALRFRGGKLFPSHRFPGWHRVGGVSVAAQMVVAGALIGALAGRRRSLTGCR